MTSNLEISAAGGRTFTVSATADGAYRSIGEALEHAEAGATISVLPGTYRERLVVTRPCRIVSEAGADTVVIAPPTGSAVTVATTQVTLIAVTLNSTDGDRATLDVGTGELTVVQCTVASAGAAAAFMRGTARLTMTRSAVSNSAGPGLLFTDRSGGIVQDTTFADITGTAVLLRGPVDAMLQRCTMRRIGGNGICASEGAGGSIDNCEVSEIGSPAVAIDTAATTRLTATTIRDTSDVGLLIARQAAPLVDGCTIARTGSAGIMLEEAAGGEVTATTVDASSGPAIYITGRSTGTFRECRITSAAGDAVVVSESSTPDFAGCTIEQPAGVGVAVTGSAAGSFTNLAIQDAGRGAVHVSGGATPTFRQAVIDGGSGPGIAASESGAGLFEDCQVIGVAAAGVAVDGGANPVLRKIVVRESETGVIVGRNGRPVLSDCEIVDARADGVTVDGGAEIDLSRTRIRGGGGAGLVLATGAGGSVTDCEIYANAGHGLTARGPLVVRVADCTVHDNGGAGLHLHATADGLQLVRVASSDNGRPDRTDEADPPRPTSRASAPGPAPEAPASPASTPDGPAPGATPPAPPTPGGGTTDPVLGPLLEELHGLVGLPGVKHEVSTLVNLQQLARRRAEAGLPVPPLSRHLVFTGAPGTGKTTVARLYARILHALGVLREGHVVEVSRADLVASIVGGTAVKTTEKFTAALGGVLFIDEAYTLAAESGSGPDFGQEAVDTIVKMMEDHRDDIVVIAAGYSHEMKGFLGSNPGLASRFTRTIEFESYTNEELVTIVEDLCTRHHYMLEYGSRQALEAYFAGVARDANFGNARTARKLFEETIARQAQRLAESNDLKSSELTKLLPEDIGSPPGRSLRSEARSDRKSELDELLATLHSMIGLTSVKSEVTNMVNLLATARRRMEVGLPVPSLSRNLVFVGAPGTGKTTVARLYGRLLSALGVLNTGQVIEVSKADLVAEYVGQTAGRTKDAFDRARGGVLFIDEAYTLTPAAGGGTDFAREAVDTILKLMEDARDEVVVIVAGYEEEMQQFFAAYSGLASRFSRYVRFENYEPEELLTIVEHHAKDAGYELSFECRGVLLEYFNNVDRGKEFGNGRFARQTLDSMITRQAGRLSALDAASIDDLRLLLPEDVEARAM